MNCRIRSRLNFRGTPFDPCRSLPQLPTSPFWSPSEQSQPGPFRTALSRPGLPGLVIMPANETYILVCGCATGNHPHTLSLMSAAILSTRTSGHAASWILRFIGAQRVRRFWAHGRQLGSNPQARVSDITVVKSPLHQQSRFPKTKSCWQVREPQTPPPESINCERPIPTRSWKDVILRRDLPPEGPSTEWNECPAAAQRI